jgi:RNA polymerase sigma-70 factor, ECF subfamily
MINVVTLMAFAVAPCWFSELDGTIPFGCLSTSAADPRMTTSRTDEELMQDWQAGDPAAFGILYSRFSDRLFRFVARMAISRAEAEEICQEAWLAVINGRTRYQPSARFVTYLFSIARRRSVDRLRRHGRQREVMSESYDVESTHGEETLQPEMIVDDACNADALMAAIDELPALQREAFLMQVEGEMSLDEIAQATDSAREAVKSRLRYAMRRLRSALGADR